MVLKRFPKADLLGKGEGADSTQAPGGQGHNAASRLSPVNSLKETRIPAGHGEQLLPCPQSADTKPQGSTSVADAPLPRPRVPLRGLGRTQPAQILLALEQGTNQKASTAPAAPTKAKSFSYK